MLFSQEFLKVKGISRIRCREYSSLRDQITMKEKKSLRSDITTFYDKYGNVTHRIDNDKELRLEQYVNIYESGGILNATAKSGSSFTDTSFYCYDGLGRVSSIVKKEGTNKWVRERRYSDSSQLLEKKAYLLGADSVVSPNSIIRGKYQYDDEGLLIMVEDYIRDTLLTISYELYWDFDPKIRMIKEKRFYSVGTTNAVHFSESIYLIDYNKKGHPETVLQYPQPSNSWRFSGHHARPTSVYEYEVR